MDIGSEWSSKLKVVESSEEAGSKGGMVEYPTVRCRALGACVDPQELAVCIHYKHKHDKAEEALVIEIRLPLW